MRLTTRSAGTNRPADYPCAQRKRWKFASPVRIRKTMAEPQWFCSWPEFCIPEWRRTRIPLLFLDENRSARGSQTVPNSFECRMRAFCAWNGNYGHRVRWDDGKKLERAGGVKMAAGMRFLSSEGQKTIGNGGNIGFGGLQRRFLGKERLDGKTGPYGPEFRVFSPRRQKIPNDGRRSTTEFAKTTKRGHNRENIRV